jgi:hypothetical protein
MGMVICIETGIHHLIGNRLIERAGAHFRV